MWWPIYSSKSKEIYFIVTDTSGAPEKFSDFPFPSPHVTNQTLTLPGRENFNYSRPGRLVTPLFTVSCSLLNFKEKVISVFLLYFPQLRG
jgi:hypothetical protein